MARPAVRAARSQGFTAVGARGGGSETHLPFAGLHQLPRPFLARADLLPARQRDALLSGFGMADLAQPDRAAWHRASAVATADEGAAAESRPPPGTTCSGP